VDYDQTHWAPVKRRGPLPTFYYHEHFVEMLDFVSTHYAHVLLEEHTATIDAFRRLPRNAQCLYVRLVNRRGRIFARDKLSYPELGSIDDLLGRLRVASWVTRPGTEHFAELLAFMTRGEIYSILLQAFTGMSRTLKKAELVEFAHAHCDPREFVLRLDPDRWLVQGHFESIRFLLFLYFGRIQDGLSQFTMRDLGLVRTQDFRDTFEPRFGERAEAEEHYFYAVKLHDLKSGSAGGVRQLVGAIDDWPEPEFAGSAAIRDRLAYRLGRKLEKSGDREGALRAYGKGESTDCSERVLRLLLAGGHRELAQGYLERCLENPRSEEEWLVATDIYERKFARKRTSALTDLLREADVIDIDESRVGAPELAAIDYYEARGAQAYRAENSLWRTFFGLLFWDELFLVDDATLHSPFEFLPASLTDRSFTDRHRISIGRKLALLDDAAATRLELLKSSTRHYGTPNGVFRWRRSVVDALFRLLEHAPAESLRSILRRFCEDYGNARYGYPDLMVIDDQGLSFIEIKAEGDQLRRNQLLRIRQFREAGLRADVVRVRWIIDPAQTYVVVDVETTGGRSDSHRVTEIGAVKLRNGNIVGRFQTLLNPQRSIPAGITRLTGISAGMVANAPYFADIADDLESFMKGAIFVAHNVDFDYGFIAREFARIGRPFRYPKLCTCAAMRKLYPGQRSYSLDSLARAFDIPLKQHHRAMCDAEAAAELLLLVNERRLQRPASDR